MEGPAQRDGCAARPLADDRSPAGRSDREQLIARRRADPHFLDRERLAATFDEVARRVLRIRFDEDQVGEVRGQVAFPRQRRIKAPEAGRMSEVAEHVLQGWRGLTVDDDLVCAGEGQAMREGLAGELVVDQGGDHPDLGQAIPGRQVLDPVGQEEGDPVPGLEARLDGPSGEPVGEGVHLAVGQAPAVEPQGLAVAPAPDRSLQVVADPPRAVRPDSADPAQCPEQSGGEAKVAL